MTLGVSKEAIYPARDAGELLGVHEGPRSRALATDALPPVNSLRIQADDQALGRVNGVIHYSKGAAFFAMLEGLWEHQLPGSFQVQIAALCRAAPAV